jgi:hypothetical protein
MKQILITTLLLLLGGSSLLLASTEEPKKDRQLRLEVDGMTETKGNLLIAIYDKEESYPAKAYTYRAVPVDSLVKHTEITLPEGRYVVSLFHDANGNNRLDTGEYGIPTEKYGFSNNARGEMGFPSFKDAAVVLKADQTIYITVH